MNRRALVAGAATLPAIAIPAAALAADRSFNLISRHRAAVRVADELSYHHDHDKPQTLAEWDAWQAQQDALWALITTPPTTIAGLAAHLAYVVYHDDRVGLNEQCWRGIYQYTLARGSHAIAGLPEPQKPIWYPFYGRGEPQQHGVNNLGYLMDKQAFKQSLS